MAQSELPIIHIYPLKDIWGHVTDGVDCPCQPEVIIEGGEMLVVHSAFDHREIVEQALAYLNGEDIDE